MAQDFTSCIGGTICSHVIPPNKNAPPITPTMPRVRRTVRMIVSVRLMVLDGCYYIDDDA